MIADAWTGIAASFLPNGATAHAMFKLPIPMLSDNCSTIEANSELGKRLRSAEIVIWNECSMIENVALTIIDRLLRGICNSNIAFGNKLMVFSGDFRQIPPVVPGGTEAQIVSWRPQCFRYIRTKFNLLSTYCE